MNGLILAEETIINTNWQDIIVTVLVALLSSTGLWGYLEQRRKKLIQKTEQELQEDKNIKEMILWMTKAQLCHTATMYLMRGYITNEEADMLEHLFKPYHDLGGNGAGEALYNQAMELPRRFNVSDEGIVGGRRCTDIQQGTSVLDDDRK